MTAGSPKSGERASLRPPEGEGPLSSAQSGPNLTSDHGNRASVDLASDPLDELPGAPEISVEQAMATVATWKGGRMPLFGLHQISLALRREVLRQRRELIDWDTAYSAVAGAEMRVDEMTTELERFRAIEAAARDAYECMKLAGAQYTPQGTRLAEVLKIKHEPQASEDNDFA